MNDSMLECAHVSVRMALGFNSQAKLNLSEDISIVEKNRTHHYHILNQLLFIVPHGIRNKNICAWPLLIYN